MLPDLLRKNLNLVVCGTAASKKSAQVAHYYAGRGNKFWGVMEVIGLTPKKLEPAKYAELINYGIGLTDVVKGQSGMDHEINFTAANSSQFREKINLYSPKVLCFNGKKSAQVYFGIKKVSFGVQPLKIGGTVCFVAPSTSGAANRTWDLSLWKELSTLVKEKSI